MKQFSKGLGRRLSSIADGFARRVGRRFSPVTVRVPSSPPRSGVNLLASLLRDRIEGEDFLSNHAPLIEEYWDQTCEEWRWFIKDEAERERRKHLLLHSIGQGLLHSVSLGPNGRGSSSVTVKPEASTVREEARWESLSSPPVYIL